MIYNITKQQQASMQARIEDFLICQGLPVNGRWSGYLDDADQLDYLGVTLGDGEITVCGAAGAIYLDQQVTFGGAAAARCEISARSGYVEAEEPELYDFGGIELSQYRHNNELRL